MDKMHEVVISSWPSSSRTWSSLSSKHLTSHHLTASSSSTAFSIQSSSLPILGKSTFSTFKKYTLPFSFPPTTSNLLIFFTIFSSLFIITCSAEPHYLKERTLDVRKDDPNLFATSLKYLARSGTILVDPQPDPSLPQNFVPASRELKISFEEKESSPINPDLEREIELESESSELEIELDSKSKSPELELDLESQLNLKKKDVAAITPPKTTNTSLISTSTVASSGTTSEQLSVATGGTVTLPTPFDSGFTNNITATCSDFMRDFLANQTFKACLPFSLLLQNSNSFFQASKSLVRITQTLDASCSANQQKCSSLMKSIASNLTSPSICSTDLASANPIITQARLGLLAYSTLFTASCLKDSSNGAYCYAQAITNSSSPTDTYLYYLPLNISLPGGSQPTCNACLKNTMEVFAQAGSVRTSAIASTYLQAAGQINVQCGPGFANATLPSVKGVEGGAGMLRIGMGMESFMLIWVAVFAWLV